MTQSHADIAKNEPIATDNYVISLNFDQKIPYYVIINPDQSWHESYSPIHATTFNSPEKAKEWMSKNSNFAEYTIPVKFQDAQNQFIQWTNQGMIRRSFPPINQSVSRPYDPEQDDKFTVLNWRYHIALNREQNFRYEDYQTWPQLHQIFQHLFNTETYYNQQNQPLVTFQIIVPKNSSFQTFQDEINLIINKITYKNQNQKTLRIFDHFLSEHGNIVYLVQYPNDLWTIENQYSNVLPKTSLENAFNYLKKFRWY